MTSPPLREGPSGLGMSNDITSSQVLMRWTRGLGMSNDFTSSQGIDEMDQRDQVVWGCMYYCLGCVG